MPCPPTSSTPPGGGGKVPIHPETILQRNGERVIIRNYEGNVYEYPEPAALGAFVP
jgi:lysine 2,3-aminomutase